MDPNCNKNKAEMGRSYREDAGQQVEHQNNRLATQKEQEADQRDDGAMT